MNLFSKITLLLFCFMLALPVFAAKDPKKGAIKSRQGEMSIRAFNAGPLFAMAKGDMPYDEKKAQMMADNLKLMLDLKNGGAWMEGTSNKDYPDDTAALPKIWETWPKIADYGKDYAKAVQGVAADAGKGKDALATAVKEMGKACKSCHDEYRKKDE